VGAAAVEAAVAAKSGIMMSIVRESDNPYRWHVGEAPLEQVANVEKEMPREFISEDGFQITEACRRYMLPLIAGENPPPYGPDGLPAYVKLKKVAVPKKTGTTFTLKS
jgi:6-phosphofructokinase 1